MTGHTLIISDSFLKALAKSGLSLIHDHAVAVTIVAPVGEPIRREWETLGDDRLLDFATELRETDDPKEAGL